MGNRTVVKRYRDYQTRDSASGRTHTITYEYDSDNLPVKIHDSTGAVTEYFYDMAGRLVKELSKTGEDTFHELRYILDEAGRVIKRAEKLEEDAVYTGKPDYAVTEFAYDANGSITKITLPEGGTITYVYDSDGRLTQENHEDKNGEISNCITYEAVTS